MAPKASQTSRGNSQESKLKDAFKKLCGILSIAKQTEGVIKSTNTLNALNEILRAYRKNGKLISASNIIDLAAALENEDGDLCSNIEPSMFITIVQATLQAEQSLGGERILHLLAGSLLRDTKASRNDVELSWVASRKATIGKECLQPILDYFLNQDNSANLRRWAGILCIQLLRGCDANVQRLELGGEVLRRSTGKLILEEPHEIIKIICGELVRTLHDEGVPLENLWPVGTNKTLYEGFPRSTQTGHGWGRGFQDYVDEIYAKKNKDSQVVVTGQLVPIFTTQLDPPHAFGAVNQNTYMFLENGEISILAPALLGTLDQLLSIPTALLEKVTIVSGGSQSVYANLIFALAESTDEKCSLDGTNIELQEITTHIVQKAVEVFKNDLADYCAGVEVEEVGEPLPNSSDDRNGASQRSTGYSEIIGKLQNNSQRDLQGSSAYTSKSKALLNAVTANTQDELDDLGNSSIMESAQGNLESMTDTPAGRNGSNGDVETPNGEVEGTAAATSPVQEANSTIKIQTQSRRGGTKVKPKAKPPIIPGSLLSNGKSSQSQKLASKPAAVELKMKSKPTGGDQGENACDSISKTKAQSQPKAITEPKSTPVIHSLDTIESQLKRAPLAPTGALQVSSTQRPATQKGMATKDDKVSSTKNRYLLNPSTASQVDTIDSSDSMTTPDPNDTSTPKMMPPPAKRPSLNNQMASQIGKGTSHSQTKKRYSLHSLKASTPARSEQDTNLFDFPQDEDDVKFEVDDKGGNKKKSGKGKQAFKKAISQDTAGKSTKSKVKPARKSAPAVLQPATSTRHSQRAAATKAKTKLRDAEQSEDEDQAIEEGVPQNAKPAPAPARKLKEVLDKTDMTPVEKTTMKISELRQQKTQTVQVPANKAGGLKQKSAAKAVQKTTDNAKASKALKVKNPEQFEKAINLDDQDVPEFQVNDHSVSPIKSGLVNGSVDDDDLYNATPKKSQSKGSVAPAEVSKVAAPSANRPGKMAGIDMAIKLDSIFGDLDKDTEAAVPIIGEPKGANLIPKPLAKEKLAGSKSSHQADVDMADAGKSPSRKTKPIDKSTTPVKENVVILQESLETAFVDVPEFSTPTLPAPIPATSRAKASTHLQTEETNEQETDKLGVEESLTEAVAGFPEEPDVTMAGEAAEPDASQTEVNEVTTDRREEASEKAEHANKKRKAEDVTKGETEPSKRRKSNEHKVASPKDDSEILAAHIQTATKQEVSKESGIPKSTKYEISKSNESVQGLEIRDKTATTAARQQASQAHKPKLSSPVRRSPRLGKAKASAETSKDAAQEKPLADDKVFRKPPIISFGAQGPLNQGRSSTRKSVVDQIVEAIQHSEETPQSVHTTSSRKRKRGKTNLAVQSPPSKRQEKSPIEILSSSIETGDSSDQADDYEIEDTGDAVLHNSPPPDPENKSRPNQSRQASSQGSRVDVNGSPLAPNNVPIDHIGKLKQRFSQEKVVKDLVHDGEEVAEGSIADQARPRSISEVFGPRITLGARSKAQPSSPEEVNTRYIAHEKTDQGQYTEIATKEVIAHGKALPDPFADKTRKSSKFTERLRASAVKQGQTSSNGVAPDRSQVVHVHREQEEIQCELPKEIVKDRSRVQDNHKQKLQYELLKMPRETSKVHFPQEKNSRHGNRSRQSGFDPEQTLFEPKHRYIDHLSDPSDPTTGNSNCSNSSDSSRETLSERPTPNEEWNMALRPHYKSLRDAVHRIADEVIIRLSDEEDRMGLMVEQYRKNAAKIMDKLTTKRNDERAKILRSLNGKKQEMTNVYTEAKGFIQESADDIKENQVTRFEKIWRKQQDDLRKQISDGRKVSEP